MPFKPGDKKPENSGRKPGTPNKRTANILELFESNDFCPGQRLIDQLNDPDIHEKLNPKEIADILEKLMQYKFPRRKAIEHTGSNGEDLFAKLLRKVDGSEK